MSKMSLALSNIEKMDDSSLLELHCALQQFKKTGFVPTVIPVTETWEIPEAHATYELPGYRYIGKPIEQPPLATRGVGGTGIWIKEEFFPQCSVVPVKRNHKDIMWIQLIDSTSTTYVAVVYSHPKDIPNHKAIMAALQHNYTELSPAGRIVITGDLNSRITQTTRGVASKYGPYENLLLDMMSATGLRPLTASKAIIDKNEHWTFLNREGGRSINDYILVEPAAVAGATYTVHQGINLQSCHRLITATLPHHHTQENISWGADDHIKGEWGEEGRNKYETEINHLLDETNIEALLSTTDPNHDSVNTLASRVTNLISTAYEKQAKRTKAKPPKPTVTPHTKATRTLIQQKTAILRSMSGAPRATAKSKWKEVHVLQKQIQKNMAVGWKLLNGKWWKQINALDHEASAAEFWRISANLRPKTSNQFPTVLTDEDGGTYRSKDTILNHVADYYTDISNNDDLHAKQFYASLQLGMSQDDMKEIAKKSKNEFRKMWRENGRSPRTQGPCNSPLLWEEFITALNRLKNRKATGRDNIPGEALKYLPDRMLKILFHLFNDMWETSITPYMWNEAITILLHKKGSRLFVKNYRPITLLASLFKLWETVLEQRVRAATAGTQPPLAQTGSQKNNSSAYTIMAKKCLVRQAESQDKPLLTLQVDMNKAYNRVCREVLWTDIYEYGVKGKLLKAVVGTYAAARETTKIGSTVSDTYKLPNGLRQGSVLSPILYILYTAKLIMMIESTNTGITTTSGTKIPCTMFVDDLATLAHTVASILKQYGSIQTYALTQPTRGHEPTEIHSDHITIDGNPETTYL